MRESVGFIHTADWRNRLFWRLQFSGWFALAILATFFVGMGFFPPGHALMLGLCRAAIGLFLTCSVRYLYRQFGGAKGNIWLKGVGIFLVSGVMALIDSLIICGITILLGLDITEESVRQFLIGSMFMRWMMFFVWSVLYFGINFWLDIQDSRLRFAEAETEAKVGELRLLRAQVNPHFLFNALNSIQAVADEPGLVRSLTQSLADYLRFSLEQRGNTQALGLELDALENYLSVEKIRFEEKLEYRIVADSAARETFAPVALVQPLLENAIKYGQRTSLPPLHVTVMAQREDGTLKVAISNSGTWIRNGDAGSTGTGLANLRRRLDLLYGPKASLSTESTDSLVTVVVRLPINVDKNNS